MSSPNVFVTPFLFVPAPSWALGGLLGTTPRLKAFPIVEVHRVHRFGMARPLRAVKVPELSIMIRGRPAFQAPRDGTLRRVHQTRTALTPGLQSTHQQECEAAEVKGHRRPKETFFHVRKNLDR